MRRSRRANFPISAAAREFLGRHFPEHSLADWCDWHWQLRHRFRRSADLNDIFQLSSDERAALTLLESDKPPMGITPHYAALMDPSNPHDPLRRTHIPVPPELETAPEEIPDPLGEQHRTVAPGLVHRYPDRVLFLATGHCATYCRYCTRSRIVGRASDEVANTRARWDVALDYIAAHPVIRDVLISGGDPLTLEDEPLGYLLERLGRIPHLDMVRIGTKVPMVLPMRITRALVKQLKRFRPLWMSIHCTHPTELGPESTEALSRLADAGVPLGSQTVLLRGVNDTPDTLKRLMHGLLKRRVRPYYLYQCDLIPGSAHFRTPVRVGLDLIGTLRGFTTGYGVPNYVVDAPDNGGKIPLLPGPPPQWDQDTLLLHNYEGRICQYPDTAAAKDGGSLPPPSSSASRVATSTVKPGLSPEVGEAR
ncbi:MAG: KamA family radical SAM protein [Magnetococcales bacterium]|nr:KamA family radical SAM protein [Magnetococcales bacterium]